MKKIDDKIWQNQQVSENFLEGIRAAIPLANTHLDFIRRLINEFSPNPKNILDLGCGDGVLGNYIQSLFPDCHIVYQDFSETMMKNAKKKTNGKGTYILSDYSNTNWLKDLDENNNFDLIITGFSIHHQEDERKKTLYKELYNLLNTKGLFLNLEHVASKTERGEKLFWNYFKESIIEYHKPTMTKEEVEEKYFNAKDSQANILSDVFLQMKWLEDIGFREVDCYFKTFELALFGGIK
ncbi:MAG: class I SAM-dependent methyltransferase [Flavobacteriales bacterium]|nr:class I SAM-dependent methyltransferase [Flavobacteriales bacterium]